MIINLQKFLVCIVVTVAFFNAQAQPLVSNDTITNVTCYGLNNGSIRYHIDGAAGPIHYSWSNGVSGYATGSCTYAVNLNNPGAALTQFQVAVNVNLAAGMNANFSNIVFTDSIGNSFPFWLKDFPTASAATFWVRVPFIPSGNSVFYLSFCGNATVSASNPNTTFDFFDNFDNGDFTLWTSNCVNIDVAGETCSAQASNTQYYSSGFSANLVGNGSCFTPPYDGAGASISRTITIANDSFVIDYNDKVEVSLYGYCAGRTNTNNSVYADNNFLGNGQNVVQFGTCNTNTSGWADETSMPFAVTVGQTTIALQSLGSDCDNAQGWFDDVRIRRYATYPPIVTVDTTGELLLDSLIAGTYTITLSDQGGNTASSTYVVTQPPAINLAPDSSNITCFGSANGSAWAIATGGTPPLQFSWNNSHTSDTITGLLPGSYSVTVSDSNSCSVSATVQVLAAASAISLSVADINVICYGDSVGSTWAIVSGGQMPYSYAWNNGGTSDTINGLSATKEVVVVTDAYGCTAADSITLTQPAAPLTALPGAKPELCSGTAQGQVWVTVQGGTSPYTYNWNTVQTTDSISNLNPGTYFVTVSDSNACSLVDSVVLGGALQPLTISLTGKNPACFTNAGGIVAANVSGGVKPYLYNWTPAEGTSDSALNLGGGQYNLLVTDSNSCIATDSITLVESPPITDVNTVVNNLCDTSIPNSVSIQVSGGISPYTFLWNPPVSTSSSASPLSAATYTINITDSNSCSVTDSVVIKPSYILQVSAAQTSNVCVSNSGEITVSARGGLEPYAFSFSNGVQNSSGIIDSLPGGTFYFSVADANGCHFADSAVIPPIDTINVVVTPMVADVNLGQTLQITSTTSQTVVTYSWTPGQGLNCYDCPNPIFSGLNSENYQLIATNTAGCTSVVDLAITVDPDYNLFFPNVFSPNNDGNNDLWKVLGNTEAVKYWSISIFNRIGEKVYESNDVYASWDGKYRGQPVLPGVYVYEAKIVWLDDYSEKVKTGSITVAR